VVACLTSHPQIGFYQYLPRSSRAEVLEPRRSRRSNNFTPPTRTQPNKHASLLTNPVDPSPLLPLFEAATHPSETSLHEEQRSEGRKGLQGEDSPVSPLQRVRESRPQPPSGNGLDQKAARLGSFRSTSKALRFSGSVFLRPLVKPPYRSTCCCGPFLLPMSSLSDAPSRIILRRL